MLKHLARQAADARLKASLLAAEARDEVRKAAANEEAALMARETDYAACRVATYSVQASDIDDYAVSCMRVAGYRLEGDPVAMRDRAFKAYCKGAYQPMLTNGRCDDQSAEDNLRTKYQ